MKNYDRVEICLLTNTVTLIKTTPVPKSNKVYQEKYQASTFKTKEQAIEVATKKIKEMTK